MRIQWSTAESGCGRGSVQVACPRGLDALDSRGWESASGSPCGGEGLLASAGTSSAPSQDSDTGTKGGVTSLSSTSSHRLWTRAGRRHTRPITAATSASTVATTALLSVISRNVCTERSPLATIPFGFRALVQVLNQRQEFLQLLRSKTLDPDQV